VIFDRFYLSCLSHASYLLGSNGVACVVDPQRDVHLYIDAAAQHGLRITHVIETHLHADFVSGHRELADLTGATIYLGAAAGALFPHVAVRDGMEVELGDCKLRFLETPGHTIESISILVTDPEKGPDPFAVLTGDTLFIGDVGRPDLSGTYTPQQLAGLLYDSLHTKLMTLPDAVEVHPAHGAGSLCGKQLGTESSSTIGKQRATNYALKASSRDEFIHLLTADLPTRPEYFARDVEMNRTGAAPLDALSPLPALAPTTVLERQQNGAVILDTRPAQLWGTAHIPGSIHIGLSGQFASWAAILLGLDSDVILVTEEEAQVEEARTRLARVGIEGVSGFLQGGFAAWSSAGLPADHVNQVSVNQIHEALTDHPGAIQLIDVRRTPELEAGHILGAICKPLDSLAKSVSDLRKDLPVAVHCKGGYRSAIATSILKREGFPEVINILGGFDAWKTCGFPVS